MKKTLFTLSAFIITFSLFCQNQEIKSITKIIKTERGPRVKIDTTYYAFEKGRLMFSNKKGEDKKHFKYNDKGLLSETSKILWGNLKQSKHIDYDESGYVTKVYFKENDEVIAETKYDLKIENENNFVITENHKDLKTLKRGNKYINNSFYEMKNNVLTFKKEYETNSLKKKTESSFNFKEKNVELSKFGNNKKYSYTLSYTYDNKPGLKAFIAYSIFGDKYFINSLLVKEIKIIDPLNIISKNNLIAEKIEKKGKKIGVTAYNQSIEYNSNEMPIKIIRKGSDKIVTETFIINYE